MIKKTKVQKEVLEEHKYCDACGLEISVGLACHETHCTICGIDLCNPCVGYEEESPGDYRIVWCKKCWAIGEEYRPKIEELNKEKDVLYEAWKIKCKIE